jgi:hypothetical protein
VTFHGLQAALTVCCITCTSLGLVDFAKLSEALLLEFSGDSCGREVGPAARLLNALDEVGRG